MSLKEDILNALKKVEDPEVRTDVVSLKLVYDFDIDEKNGIVKFKFMPTVPNCPIGIQLAMMVRGAVKDVPGVKKVKLRVENFMYKDQLNTYLEEIEKEEEENEYIAITVDKSGVLWDDYFDKADYFMIYTKYGNFISARENTLAKESNIDNIAKIASFLSDVKVLICKKIDEETKEKLKSHYGIKVFITTKASQKDALAEFFSNKNV